MRNLFKLATLLALLAGLLVATPAGALTDNLFPRPFQYAGVRSSGWPLLYYTNNTPTGSYPPLTQPLDEDAIRAYARYPLVCLDMQPTFFYRHDIIEKIKEINPNCKVLVYILDGHWYPPAGNDPTKDVLYGMATDDERACKVQYRSGFCVLPTIASQMRRSGHGVHATDPPLKDEALVLSWLRIGHR